MYKVGRDSTNRWTVRLFGWLRRRLIEPVSQREKGGFMYGRTETSESRRDQPERRTVGGDKKYKARRDDKQELVTMASDEE